MDSDAPGIKLNKAEVPELENHRRADAQETLVPRDHRYGFTRESSYYFHWPW